MPTPIYVVDAFASAPFKGNPAGVVVGDAFPPDEVMQGLATDIGYSETVFLAGDGGSELVIVCAYTPAGRDDTAEAEDALKDEAYLVRGWTPADRSRTTSGPSSRT